MTESFVQAILQTIWGEMRKQKIKISRPIIEMTEKFSYHPPNTCLDHLKFYSLPALDIKTLKTEELPAFIYSKYSIDDRPIVVC